MIIYQAEYKYVHQIEPVHEVIGYFKNKNSAINKLEEKYKLNSVAKMVLGSDHRYVNGNNYYYINELKLED